MRDSTKKTLFMTAAGLGTLFAVRAAVRSQRRYDLRGKVALVTGGSRGLGLVLARELARQGMRLAICARQEDEVKRAYQDLANRGAHVLAITCDVTKPGQVDSLVNTVLGRFGEVHVLINNAGTIEVGPMETMTRADYEEAMNTHFWAALDTIHAVLPQMRARGDGRIVNITSIGGKVSVPHLLPYGASKFALVGLSEGLRAELLKDRIYVTTVCPGLMRTGSPRNAIFKGQHQAEYTWFSISDALPIFSISAERAARTILRAFKYGDPEVLLSLPTKAAVWFHGLFPGLTADLMALTNRLLPAPGGIGSARAKGRESESALSPSWLTTLSDRAAERNNEMEGDGRMTVRPAASTSRSQGRSS
jgi:short-subunit dehydrogenase